MPAYNFKAQFALLVESGVKPHTVRPKRKHPTKVGDTLYLYTGMRTKACRLLKTAICTRIRPIKVEFYPRRVTLDGKVLSRTEATELALRDGFDAPESDYRMFWFFWTTYGDVFEGELIEWSTER